METLIIVLLVAYNVWLVTYLLLERQPKKDKPEKSVPPQESKSISNDNDIIGKSKFKVVKIEKPVPLTAKLTPLDAKEEKGEDIPNVPATFVGETENKPSARVLDNKINDAFSDTRMEELPSEYNDEDDYNGTPNNEFATGGTFDEIKESVNIADNPNATPNEKQKAGKIFTELDGTNLFEKIIGEYPERKNRIMKLMDNLYKTVKDIENHKLQKKEFKMPTSVEEFNIRDYV